MLNLFPIFGTPKDSISSEEFMGWKATQTPSYIQAQQDMIDDLFKKNYELKKENEKIKKENVELMERVNEIDSDMNEEYRAEVFRLRNDNAIWKAKHQVIQNDYKKCTEQRDEYKHQLNAANKEIDALKTKHPMYPLHWGGVSNLFQKAKDLTEDVEVDLDKSLDEQCDEVKKSQNWSTLKVAMEDAIQAKQKEVYGVEERTDRRKVRIEFPNEVPYEWEELPKTFPNEFQEEPAFLNCACGDCYEKTKQYNKFQDAYTECKITGYKIPKENSWEETASDLALRVAKLEEHIKYMPKISFTK